MDLKLHLINDLDLHLVNDVLIMQVLFDVFIHINSYYFI